jgi:adenylate cyclase
MNETTQKRQLAAIMFTDIVGYTALMGEDEDKAFALLKKNREIQKPLIEKHNGKWLKEIGDGVLASFSTVTDAVSCAREIQETCQSEENGSVKGFWRWRMNFDNMEYEKEEDGFRPRTNKAELVN